MGGASGAEEQREEMKGHWWTWDFSTVSGETDKNKSGTGARLRRVSYIIARTSLDFTQLSRRRH